MTFHKNMIFMILAAVLAMLLAACGAVGSGVTTPPTEVVDAQSAGAFMPTLTGYTVTGASSLSDAISAAAQTGVEELGNPVLERTVSSVDRFVSCYEQVGAVAANIYTQVNLGSIVEGGDIVPQVGAVAIVNQDRIRENLISCVTSGVTAQDEGFSAQAVQICQSSGSFSSGGDTFTYIYISNAGEFCSAVENHFSGIN